MDDQLYAIGSNGAAIITIASFYLGCTLPAIAGKTKGTQSGRWMLLAAITVMLVLGTIGGILVSHGPSNLWNFAAESLRQHGSDQAWGMLFLAAITYPIWLGATAIWVYYRPATIAYYDYRWNAPVYTSNLRNRRKRGQPAQYPVVR